MKTEENKYLLSPSKEIVSIYIDGSWKFFTRNDVISEFRNKQDQEKAVVEEIAKYMVAYYVCKQCGSTRTNLCLGRCDFCGCDETYPVYKDKYRSNLDWLHEVLIKTLNDNVRKEERQCLDTLQQFVQEKIIPLNPSLVGKNIDQAILWYVDKLRKDAKNTLLKEDVFFLEWVYQRLLCVHGENKNYDYMHKFYKIIDKLKGE